MSILFPLPQSLPRPLQRWILLRRPEGNFRLGNGWLSAWLCTLFGALSLLGVLVFNFPAWLTIPELRAGYDIALMRAGLAGLMIACGTFGLFAIANRRLLPALAGLAMLALSAAFGGADTPLGSLDAAPAYIGLDWFIIGLLTTGGLFILLEKLAPLRPEQPVLRAEWMLDMKHFFFMHLMLGGYLALTNALLVWGLDWARVESLTSMVSALPVWLQLLGCSIACAGLAMLAFSGVGGDGWLGLRWIPLLTPLIGAGLAGFGPLGSVGRALSGVPRRS